MIEQIYKKWNANLVFAGISFRSGLIFLHSVAEDMAECGRIIVSWEGNTMGAHADSDNKAERKATKPHDRLKNRLPDADVDSIQKKGGEHDGRSLENKSYVSTINSVT